MSGGGRKGEEGESGETCAQTVCSSLFETLFFVCVTNLIGRGPIAVYMVYKCAGFCPFLSVTSNLML